jgi:hypothetical protein
MECIVETKASTILELFAGLRGTLSVTFEEGTSAACLYDLLAKHSKNFLLEDRLAVGVDRMQRNFGPLEGEG